MRVDDAWQSVSASKSSHVSARAPQLAKGRRSTGSAHSSGVFERLHSQIVAAPGRAFTEFRFWPFYRDLLRWLLLRQNGDEIGEMNGWTFHVDGVHLNRRGGAIVVDVVQEFLDACSAVS